jgi:AraC-like DNA-binding protein
MHEKRVDIQTLGHGTREWIVTDHDCSAVASHRIRMTGISELETGYCMVRCQADSFVVACCEGSAEVLLEGQWRRWDAGTVLLTPPHIWNGMRATPGVPCRLCWVIYDERRGGVPRVATHAPHLVAAGQEPFHTMIRELHREVFGPGDPVMLQNWSDLVHLQALRLAGGKGQFDRLWPLWEQVHAELDQPWTVERLARRAFMSSETLRRLCQDTLGRSPMQQVTHLRMQRAVALLRGTTLTLTDVAHAVGYSDAFAFAKTFKRKMGITPSHYRS